MTSLLATFLMMNTSLGPRTAKALSWGVMGLLCALAVYAAYSWAWDRGRDTERDRWEAAAAKLEKADAKADAAGTAKAGTVKQEIDDANERARHDAAGSDDPLDAISKRLRAEGERKGD